MDDEAESLLNRITTAARSKLGPKVAKEIYKYYTKEEYTAILMFQSELKDINEAYIIDYIGNKFRYNEAEKNNLYLVLKQQVFGSPNINTFEEHKNTSNNNYQKINDKKNIINDLKILPKNLFHTSKSIENMPIIHRQSSQKYIKNIQENIAREDIINKLIKNTNGIFDSIPSNFLISFPDPYAIDWNISKEEHQIFTQYIYNECPRFSLILASAENFMKILAIGRKNNLDLLSLLIDIYDHYKIKRVLKNNSNAENNNNNNGEQKQKQEKRLSQQWSMNINVDISLETFLDDCNFFQNISETCRSTILHGISFYMRKIQNSIQFQSYLMIDDFMYPYAQYAFALSQCGRGLPFQVDLWIIPHHTQKHAMKTFGGHISEDSDVDEFEHKLNLDSNDATDETIGKIEKRLQNRAIPFFKESICHDSYLYVIREAIEKGIKYICSQVNENGNGKNVNFAMDDNVNDLYSYKRLVIIIDRRDSESSKAKMNFDNLYVFQPPGNFGRISKSYCAQSMFSKTQTFLLPKFSYEQKRYDLNVLDGFDGRMFCLSFHLHHPKKIRVYFYRGYWCTRFFPRHIYQLWPKYFLSSLNSQFDQRLNKSLIHALWTLPLNDDIFQQWVPVITDSPL